MEEIEKCLKNAKKYSDQIDDQIQYRQFLKYLKEVVDQKLINEEKVKNPFTFLLDRLPDKYYKYVNMMYLNFFKKMDENCKKNHKYYLGETLLSNDGKIIVPLSQNDEVSIDEFATYGLAMLYYGSIYNKLNEKNK